MQNPWLLLWDYLFYNIQLPHLRQVIQVLYKINYVEHFIRCFGYQAGCHLLFDLLQSFGPLLVKRSRYSLFG